MEESSEDSDSEKEEENVVQCVVPKCHKAVNAAILRPSPVIEKVPRPLNNTLIDVCFMMCDH